MRAPDTYSFGKSNATKMLNTNTIPATRSKDASVKSQNRDAFSTQFAFSALLQRFLDSVFLQLRYLLK